MAALVVLKPWTAGAYVDGSCVGKLAGRLEDGTLLTVVEQQLLDVVQRELSQIHLSVLGIAQLYAVVEDAQVAGAHAAHIDGLDASHASVVLQLHACKVAQRVGYGVGAEPFQLFPLHDVAGNDLAVGRLGPHDDLAHLLDAVQ